MNSKNIVEIIALVVLIIGGLNWGMVGLFNFDLVAALFGSLTELSRIVYTLVGVSAVYVAISAIISHLKTNLNS